MELKLQAVSANENHPNWDKMIARNETLYEREDDIRSEFQRDYTRILHTNAYRRLKHKTQVFFSPQSDHICTRIEHVNYVESISYTIAKYLGLNTELTRAIAIAHDLGHSPFGHKGETEVSRISNEEVGETIWHEKMGLHFVDNIELLEDPNHNQANLMLTYSVRDGIISHCGEVDQNGLKPREEAIDLDTYTRPNEYAPFTWEACVVKIADKIAYLGRDIEDAISLHMLSEEKLAELAQITESTINQKSSNTVIINALITDLCKNTTLEKGLTLSQKGYSMMNRMKEFNYKNIYLADRIKPSDRYFCLVIQEIFHTLKTTYQGRDSLKKLKELATFYPNTAMSFIGWLEKYSNLFDRTNSKYKNKVIYDITQERDYYRAILDYMIGMTDNYAIETYHEIIRF